MAETEPRNEVVTLLICSREYSIFRMYGSWTNWNNPLHHMSHIIWSYLMAHMIWSYTVWVDVASYLP